MFFLPLACDGADETAPDAAAACAEAPDPARDRGWTALLSRLEAQGCLHEDDVVAAESWMARFHEEDDTWCDGVWRAVSDGPGWHGARLELVREHASVADVYVGDDGRHVLAFNELHPGRLVETLRENPARFWRQGLLGLGGIGLAIEEDGVWRELAPDLRLDGIELAIDPDIGRRKDGTWRMSWYAVDLDQMVDGVWDPAVAPTPHTFYRSGGASAERWEPRVLAVATSVGQGGADPTVLERDDGGELMTIGQWGESAPAFLSADGIRWDPEQSPVASTGFPAGTPDVVAHPDGGYRMVYMDGSRMRMASSEDGMAWSEGDDVIGGPHVSGPSVALDPDGRWWLYFQQRDLECAAGR